MAHSSTTVRLDKPYGAQSYVCMLQGYAVSIIIAGGSGIGFTWPLVWSVLATANEKDSEYLASSSSSKKVLFIWIIRNSLHLGWLGTRKVDELRFQRANVVIPPAAAHNGHPDIKEILVSWLKTFAYPHRGKIGVVCSGPDGMNRSVRNICSSQGRDINIEIENFGW